MHPDILLLKKLLNTFLPFHQSSPQNIVEEHGRYISAHHDGLQTRNHRAAWGLAILVVILITIIAAFATAFAWKSSHIREMEDMVNAIKDELDKKIEVEVQAYMNHQVAFRSALNGIYTKTCK